LRRREIDSWDMRIIEASQLKGNSPSWGGRLEERKNVWKTFRPEKRTNSPAGVPVDCQRKSTCQRGFEELARGGYLSFLRRKTG